MRKCFISFDYEKDNWRVNQIRNFHVFGNDKPIDTNDWEKIKKGGSPAICRWIDAQMKGKSCTVLLIGERTFKRKFVKYEIKQSILKRKALVGIYIDQLKDCNGETCDRGRNPFEGFSVKRTSDTKTVPLSQMIKVYSPWGFTSKGKVKHIKNNMADWVEDAIQRKKYYR